jgi:MFS transporter, PPP family, 3-phenylpropionic acid transporter
MSSIISALFYFSYFAAIGIYVPYWTLYLRDLGLSSLQIGTLYSIPSLCRIIVPPLVGYFADRFNRRSLFLILAAAGQLIPLLLICWFHTYPNLLILISAFALFNSTVLPLGEATVQEEHEKGSLDYGRTRLWGTLSFILLAIAFGKLLDFVGNVWILIGIIICFAIHFFITFVMPEGKMSFKLQSHKVRLAFLTPGTWIFFACVMLMNIGHGTFYGFYSIYLADLGFQESGIGIHWAVAASVELIVFMFASRIMTRFRAETLISFCCITAVVRWYLTGTFTSFGLLTAVQSLHAFTFGLFHATCLNLLHRIFPEGSRSIGQSLYTTLGNGVGNFTGIMFAGIFWDQYGGKLFYASSAIMIVAFVLSIFLNRGVVKSTMVVEVVDQRRAFQDPPEKPI